MILFRPGSHLDLLITLLSIVGEYPVSSLYLLGNERVFKAMVRELTLPQSFHNSITGEKLQLRLLTIAGKHPNKTVRLCRQAMLLLDWVGTREFYLSVYDRHNFSGSLSHVERNHRVAETAAMFLRAGIECRPWLLPKLQMRQRQLIVENPSFYFPREIKQIEDGELNKTKFTRLTGGLFRPGSRFVVYNTRNAVMKWNGMGEFKTKNDLLAIGRVNAAVSAVDSAILFGRSYEVAMDTLLATAATKRCELRFDSIYQHIYFIPLDAFGIRQLAFLQLSNWNEEILELLFDPEARSYDNGSFEYDALVDGRYVLSYLNGDIARLIRFRDAAMDRRRSYEVLCYPEQFHFLRAYLPEHVRLKTIEISLIEENLGVKARCLLER